MEGAWGRKQEAEIRRRLNPHDQSEIQKGSWFQTLRSAAALLGAPRWQSFLTSDPADTSLLCESWHALLQVHEILILELLKLSLLMTQSAAACDEALGSRKAVSTKVLVATESFVLIKSNTQRWAFGERVSARMPPKIQASLRAVPAPKHYCSLLKPSRPAFNCLT